MRNESVFYNISGYCPYLDKENYITAKYAVIYLSGQLSPGYKLLSYKCEYSNGCDENCPLEEKALRFKPSG